MYKNYYATLRTSINKAIPQVLPIAILHVLRITAPHYEQVLPYATLRMYKYKYYYALAVAKTKLTEHHYLGYQ